MLGGVFVKFIGPYLIGAGIALIFISCILAFFFAANHKKDTVIPKLYRLFCASGLTILVLGILFTFIF